MRQLSQRTLNRIHQLVEGTQDISNREGVYLLFYPRHDEIGISFFELPIDRNEIFQVWISSEVGVPDDLEELYRVWCLKAICNKFRGKNESRN